MKVRLDDYIDGDVAYLMGLITARGTISESHGIRQITIQFPYASLEAQGISSSFDQRTSIRLGIENIRERLLTLLSEDITTVKKEGEIDLVVRFMHNSMAWRNILLLTGNATSFPYFRVPPVFFDPDLPLDWKQEFVRGYADVSGNIRHANRYVNNRHRVRLDILNYPTNWKVAIQLCTLLQEHLAVPVQLITWGHPNMGRNFREHQLNIFARPFLSIGFSFEHKQKILEEFVEWDDANTKDVGYDVCPGVRSIRKTKPHDQGENDSEHLAPDLLGKHFDAYWQICKALGCSRVPSPGNQLTMVFEDDEETQ
jgi:hypothetical protein